MGYVETACQLRTSHLSFCLKFSPSNSRPSGVMVVVTRERATPG